MPKFNKPDTPNVIWGVNALEEDLTRPDDSYIQTGWTQVKPPYEYENYSMNKLYQGFAYYNQLGLPEWDSDTEYQAGKSYVQASNMKIYKCIQTNVNKNPATAGNSSFWRLFDEEILGTGDFSSDQFVGNIPFIQSGVKLNLKIQVSSHLYTGIPSGSDNNPSTSQDHVHKADTVAVVFPEPFNNACIGVFPTGENSGGFNEGDEYSINVDTKTKTGVAFHITRVTGTNTTNEPAVIRYLAIGY